jgi:hypothetical protein
MKQIRKTAKKEGSNGEKKIEKDSRFDEEPEEERRTREEDPEEKDY